MIKSLTISIALLLSANVQAFQSYDIKTMTLPKLCSEARTLFLFNLYDTPTAVTIKQEFNLFREIDRRDVFSTCENTWY